MFVEEGEHAPLVLATPERVQVLVARALHDPKLLRAGRGVEELPGLFERRVRVLRARDEELRRRDLRRAVYGVQVFGAYAEPQAKLRREQRPEDRAPAAEAHAQ